jgi:tripartite-type tricarboxylate transporter receptor subunit TctC
VFVVHSSSPVKSFRDLLELMRGQVSGVEYVSPSIGSGGNMVAEYIAAKEKIKLVHVVYRGGGAAILDLVAGHVKVGSMTTWYSLSGPAGLPKDIVDRLNREVNKAMDVPKVREHLAQETV